MLKSFSFVRAFTTQATETVAKASRQTLKPELSRKTYLLDAYTHVLRHNPIILALHNSTLLKADDKKFRNEIRKAGAKFMVVRSSLFKVALRGLEHEDPASIEANKQMKKVQHPFAASFDGPSAIITIPELDPAMVKAVVKAVEGTGNKLILLGGQVDGSVLNRPEINQFKEMPTLPQLHAELAGVLTVLGGAGLVHTLEASSKMLYLTLDEHRKNIEPKDQ